MSGFFGRKAGEVIEIPTAADLTKRVSALEDKEYERAAIARGEAKIGNMFVRRGADSYEWVILPENMYGVKIGSAEQFRQHTHHLHLPWYDAICLRDWLLKEFPLETPKAEDKKPGGKK